MRKSRLFKGTLRQGIDAILGWAGRHVTHPMDVGPVAV